MNPYRSTGKILRAEDAVVSAVSSASLYGSGIFTTIAIFGGELFVWEKHWRRLRDSAQKRRINISQHTEESTREALGALVARNDVGDGRARITFFDESPSTIWANKSAGKASLLIATGDRRRVQDNFRLTVSPYPIYYLAPLSGIKSCNYLDHLIALDEARSRGFDEAVQINERGEVTSASMANIFWLKDGILFTPSLKTGCLAGTTREFVLENLECLEVEAPQDELQSADEIFLTSAGLGILQVAEFELKKLKKAGHPVLDLLPGRA